MRCKWIDICPLRRFEEQGKLELKWKKEYCEGNYKKCVRYKMEEKGQSHPDNMLPNGEIDERLK